LFAGCSASGSDENIRPKYQSFKDIPGVTQEEISALENLLVERPRLVYGICVPTEAFLLEEGSVGGFARLFCDRLSELFGFEFDFLPGSWEEMQERIVSREINLVVDFTATPVTRRIEIDGVDVERGIQTMGGSEQGYRELLDILRGTPKNEDLQLFVTQVHALKSATNNIGALSLSADAARLEDAGKRGDIAAIRNELDRFREALIRLAESIQVLNKRVI
jgi:hypothetical protein